MTAARRVVARGNTPLTAADSTTMHEQLSRYKAEQAEDAEALARAVLATTPCRWEWIFCAGIAGIAGGGAITTIFWWLTISLLTGRKL